MRISDWSSDVCSSDLVKVDIGERERPLSVNLFMGPTGVGKTEIVRLLALAIHGRADAFCRIDMHTLAQERSEEHTSELQSLMRISYAVFCLKKKNITNITIQSINIIKSSSNINTRFLYYDTCTIDTKLK